MALFIKGAEIVDKISSLIGISYLIAFIIVIIFIIKYTIKYESYLKLKKNKEIEKMNSKTSLNNYFRELPNLLREYPFYLLLVISLFMLSTSIKYLDFNLSEKKETNFLQAMSYIKIFFYITKYFFVLILTWWLFDHYNLIKQNTNNRLSEIGNLKFNPLSKYNKQLKIIKKIIKFIISICIPLVNVILLLLKRIYYEKPPIYIISFTFKLDKDDLIKFIFFLEMTLCNIATLILLILSFKLYKNIKEKRIQYAEIDIKDDPYGFERAKLKEEKLFDYYLLIPLIMIIGYLFNIGLFFNDSKMYLDFCLLIQTIESVMILLFYFIRLCYYAAFDKLNLGFSESCELNAKEVDINLLDL